MALINIPDPGARYTDEEIKALEEKINSIYSEAQSDIQKKLDDHTAKFQKKDAMYQKKLQDKEITQAEYDAWKKGQVFTGKQWAAKKQEITAVLNNSNNVAAAMINSSAIDVFGENANFLSYSLEHTAGVNFGFGLYNTEAVTKLIKDDPQVLPKWKIDQKKDYTWNQQNLNRSLTQGIIQGESLDKISKRVSTNLAGSNKNLMKTFAKTGMTQAQNSGRMTQLERAKALGLNVKKKWVATLDARTRTAHQELDGQFVDLDKPFKAEGYTIRYPGDPEAHPSLVYNCRCALTGDLVDYPSTYERYDNIAGKPIKNMTYKEWKASKKAEAKKSNNKSVKKSKTVDIDKIISGQYSKTHMIRSESSDNINRQVLATHIESLTALNERFPKISEFIEASGCEIASSAEYNGAASTILSTVTRVNPKTNELRIQALNYNPNSAELKSIDMMINYTKQEVQKGFYMPATDYENYLLNHEYGHMVQNYLIKDKYDWNKFRNNPERLTEKYDEATKEMGKEFIRFGQKQGIIKDLSESVNNVSGYALKKIGYGDHSDLFAESFANMVSGEPNEWGKTMEAFLKYKEVL